MMSSSTSITWQSWSRKWGDWTKWIRSATTARAPVHRNLRVAPVNGQRQASGGERIEPQSRITSS